MSDENQFEDTHNGEVDDSADLIDMAGSVGSDAFDEGDGDPRDQQIADLEAQVAEFKDQALRALAEQENLRRRTEREKEQWKRYSSAELAKDLLNAADNLRRALDAAPEDRDTLDQSIKNVLVGVEMTEKEFLGAFEKHGIKKIDPMGEKFDYNFHQAMMEVDDPSCPPGTVVQVLAPGYVLHDRLLRAAMVGVSKGGAPENHESIDTTA